MSRALSRGTQVAIDLTVLSIALWLAVFLRFDAALPRAMTQRVLLLWPYVIALQYGALVGFGVHRYQWRYVGLREVTRIFAAIGVAAVVLVVVRLIIARFDNRYLALENLLLPIGVTVIDLVLAFLAIGGVRAVRRLLAERADELRRSPGARAPDRIKTILIGAGQAGLIVAKELSGRPDLGLKPVGFLDDDPQKLGTSLHGLRVLGTTADLVRMCAAHGARQALITIAGAPGKDIRRIAERCRESGVTTKIIPGIYEIVGGAINMSRIRDVEIEDLLGRAQVQLDVGALERQLSGKVVLVTGAGGSIGAELCRQVSRFAPRRLLLLEQAETALFHVHRELEAAARDLALVPLIADICDPARIRGLMTEHRPDVVFHAAAHKHVPMMERNPDEAVKNNVLGTKLLADEADRAGVASFVTISTDKAVNPTSIMGASKRAAEIYAQSLARRSRTQFVTVRFGNVLGSAGSVIPLFREQIAAGGPVRVTHPDMKRYFMTIPEACQLVMQAGAMGKGGEIFILDMGEPVRILDLARDMIELSGFVPGEDIAIEFSGMRPGEKLFEELATDAEHAGKTDHPKIFVGGAREVPPDQIERWIGELAGLCDRDDAPALRAKLRELIPEYRDAVLIPPPSRRRSEGPTAVGRKTGPAIPLTAASAGGGETG